MEVTKFYELHFPVWKQGDDLARHMDDEETLADAFEALAKQYESAAAEARRMAVAARLVPQMKVRADTHYIEVEAPPHPVMEQLVTDGVLEESRIGAEPSAD